MTASSMFSHRISIITGHYGTGKTELAVNLALALAAEGSSVMLADLDIVNPYFRSRERRPMLEAALRELAKADHVKAFVDVEMSSTGQMIDDVRMALEGRKPLHYLGHAGGVMPTVEEMVDAAKTALKEVK